MEAIRGITVCVGYDDLLAVTLPRNLRHLTECVVVTSTADTRTQSLVKSTPKARLCVTDEFYRDGAPFNKGMALEKAGFDCLGRDGWILIFDADTLFPDVMPLPTLEVGRLYNAPRRVLEDPSEWSEGFNWVNCPRIYDGEFPGYYQLFHADDPSIAGKEWYGTGYDNAGGGDSVFQWKWREENKRRLDFHVLHLGPCFANWYGRTNPRLDHVPIDGVEASRQAMHDCLVRKGWR